MNNKIKIYCVLFDTMSLTKDIINIANKNKMQLLLQVGGCFTLTSTLEIFIGKMPSDIIPFGIGHRTMERYRDPVTKIIHIPCRSEFIMNQLFKKGWEINLHNLSPNDFDYGESIKNNSYIHTDSYPGGYKIRRDEVINGEVNSSKMMDDLLLGGKNNAISWQKRELQFTKSIQNKIISLNTFYFIRHEHFHNYPSYVKKYSKIRQEKTIKIADRRDKRSIELMSKWDFDEPNSIFWFFADHGSPDAIGNIPKANGYLSWVLFKDNTENSIKSKSNLISIRDFSATIMDKFDYSYKYTKENKSIFSSEENHRVYFVEDGRARINKQESTTAISCMCIDRQNERPTKILQVGYFKPNKKFYYHVNILYNNGIFKKVIQLNKNNKKYKINLSYLKKKLQKRFKWVK